MTTVFYDQQTMDVLVKNRLEEILTDKEKELKLSSITGKVFRVRKEGRAILLRLPHVLAGEKQVDNIPWLYQYNNSTADNLSKIGLVRKTIRPPNDMYCFNQSDGLNFLVLGVVLWSKPMKFSIDHDSERCGAIKLLHPSGKILYTNSNLENEKISKIFETFLLNFELLA